MTFLQRLRCFVLGHRWQTINWTQIGWFLYGKTKCDRCPAELELPPGPGDYL